MTIRALENGNSIEFPDMNSIIKSLLKGGEKESRN